MQWTEFERNANNAKGEDDKAFETWRTLEQVGEKLCTTRIGAHVKMSVLLIQASGKRLGRLIICSFTLERHNAAVYKHRNTRNAKHPDISCLLLRLRIILTVCVVSTLVKDEE